MLSFLELLEKYDINAPRYTSYPAVPHWRNSHSENRWISSLVHEIDEGIATYIHLPFCPKLCSFCACNKLVTSQYDKVLDYIDYLPKELNLYLQKLNKDKLKIVNLHVGGGTPTFLKTEDVRILFGNLFKNFDILQSAELSFEANPQNTDAAKLQAFFDVGFRRISFGIQDFDPKVQETINRIQSFDLTKEVTELARKTGFSSVNYDIIYGLPFQTPDTIVQTFNKVITLRPDRIAFYGYAHLPTNFAQQKHIDKFEIPKAELRYKLNNIGRQILLENGYVEIGMDHFALEGDSLTIAMRSGKLTRNFMGYSENFSPVILPLGYSSIGNTTNIFVQNAKDIDLYKNDINAGKLPIVRGHELSELELSTRSIITKLMTKFEIDVPQDFAISQQFQGFIDDGIVELSNKTIRVTQLGKSFLRVIASSFDGNFHLQTNNLFSKTV